MKLDLKGIHEYQQNRDPYLLIDYVDEVVPGKIANGFTTTITNAGTGYSGGSPTVSVSGGGGTGLAISATVSGDNISALTVTNPGSGYTSAPTLTISAGSGTQATGTLALTRGRVDTWNSLNKYATITTLSCIKNI